MKYDEALKILGLDRKVDLKTIKSTYHKLAQKHHPDRNGKKEDFIRIQKAYEFIIKNTPSFANKMEADHENNLHVQINIPFNFILTGGTVEVQPPKGSGCRECGGSGFFIDDEEYCLECDGTGFVYARKGQIKLQVPCSSCNGTGHGKKITCDFCHGTGEDPFPEVFKLPVSPGVEINKPIVYKNRGLVKNGIQGDLYVTYHLIENKKYKVKHPHLYTSLNVSFSSFCLGGNSYIITPLNEKIKISWKAGTQPGSVIIIKNKGIPQLIEDEIVLGDIRVVLKIKIPTHLTDKQKALLEEWSALEKKTIVKN